MFVRKGTMLHRKGSRRNSLTPSARRASIASTSSALNASRRPSASPSMSSQMGRSQTNLSVSPSRDGRRSVSPRNSLTPPTSACYLNAGHLSPGPLGGSAMALSALQQNRSPGISPSQTPRTSPRTSPRSSLAVPNEEPERRRSSTTISIDDRRRLCLKGKEHAESAPKSYGSILYQMKEASVDSSGIIDYFFRTIRILESTALMTLVLVGFLILKMLMVVIGIQYLQECPKQPKIPIYLLVGGVFGLMKVGIQLWRQLRSRRYEPLDEGFVVGVDIDDFGITTTTRITDCALTLFLLIWFGYGNYWVLEIYQPRFEPLLHEPNNWCDRTVYVFSIVVFVICYATAAFLLLATTMLACFSKILFCRSG